MRTLFSLALLLSLQASAQVQHYLVPPASSINFGLSGTLTLTGATGPQIDSTSTSPLEIRSRAAATTDAHFRFYAHNAVSSGGFLFKFSEQAGTSVSDRMSMDHDGTLRLYPDGAFGAHLELFGGIKSTNGGADGPVRIYGGAATTAFTGRLLSVRKASGDVEVVNVRSDGTTQFAGVATGSLGTCNGSAARSIQVDSTEGRMKFCDGTSWLPIATFLEASATQDVASIAAQTCSSFTIALTGATTTDESACSFPAALETNLSGMCWPGTDVINFRLCNPTGSAIDPASGTYSARVVR